MSEHAADVIPLTPLRRRHLKADDEAARRDVLFFRKHPDRTMHVRRSLAFEMEGWGRESHLSEQWILVRIDRGRPVFHKQAISTAADIPDNEDFLRSLLVWIKTFKQSGQPLSVTPDVCSMLLSTAGIA